jgi:hypothetical protein
MRPKRVGTLLRFGRALSAETTGHVQPHHLGTFVRFTQSEYLEARQQRLTELLAELARDVDSIENVKVDKKGQLHVTALEAVVPDAAKQLQRPS